MHTTASLVALLLGAVPAFGWSPVTPGSGPAGNGAKLLRANAPVMPIGVPKVAYRVPGATQADWVEIYNRLYRDRILFLGQ